MSTQTVRTIKIEDETRQKRATVTMPADARWLEVSARATDLMELPVDQGGEPLVYHLYRLDTGESILAHERVGATFHETEEHRVLQAPEMRPAQEPRQGQ